MTRKANEDSPPYNGFKAAGREILARLKTPFLHTTFWLNLGIGVVGFGGIAIWIEWWHWGHSNDPNASLSNLKLALATVFPAVMGGSALELILSKKVIPRNIGIAALAICFIAALYLLGFGRPSDSWAIRIGVVCCLFSVVIWWIARGLDETMQDEEQDPEAAVGGPADRDLKSAPSNIKT